MRFLPALFPFLVLAQDPFLTRFEPNTGQYPPNVRLVRRSPDNRLYLTRDAVVLRNNVRVQIAGIDANAQPRGDAPSPPIFNFYTGTNRSAWRTGVSLFQAVGWQNVYPSTSARLTIASLELDAPLTVLVARLAFTLEPGADLNRVSIRVLNTGATPMPGPGGIWYTGGRIPGVFTVTAQAFQLTGANRTALASSLRIGAQEGLFIDVPDRNPSLRTEVEFSFPSYDLVRRDPQTPTASDGARYLTSRLEQPTDFGEDGKLPAPACDYICADAVLTRFDAAGHPIWVTVLGGARQEDSVAASPVANGVALIGSTRSDDFPVTANAPHSRPASPGGDLFLAWLDRDNGRMHGATYAGLANAWAQTVASQSGDLLVGGGFASESTPFVNVIDGYILRWNPAANRILFSRQFDAPIVSLALDSSSIYFATDYDARSFIVGALDSSGNMKNPPVTIDVGEVPAFGVAPRFVAVPNGDLWVPYQILGPRASRLNVARIPADRRLPLINRTFAYGGYFDGAGLTPAGNLKVLVRNPIATEPTTADAPLTAACPDSVYFAILTPTGDLAHATYAPAANFDFTARNEPQSTPPATLACFASAAGRTPLTAAAPGQLITLTGGGFGPPVPHYYGPDAQGNYPTSAEGFRVRIDSRDVPIIATARGLIAVQVPFELDPNPPAPHTIELFENERPIGTIPLNRASYLLTLFDTGDRGNSLNVPALAALNQDGTVNSPSNPATPGSIVSLFGTGLGLLTPRLATGALNPIPPQGPLSTASLLRACLGCEILYLGSAPGLSTSVVQINVRLVADPSPPDGSVRPHGIGMAVSESLRSLFVSSTPQGVVFVK